MAAHSGGSSIHGGAIRACALDYEVIRGAGMGEVTRYESTLCDGADFDGQGHADCTAGLVEQPDGDWVLYDDHRQEVTRQREALEGVKAAWAKIAHGFSYEENPPLVFTWLRFDMQSAIEAVFAVLPGAPTPPEIPQEEAGDD